MSELGGREMSILIRAGKIVDGTGSRPVERGAVLIDGKTIVEVGQQDEVKPRSGTETLDVGERIVIPGLIDCHAHFCMGYHIWTHQKYVPQEITKTVLRAVNNANRCLRTGVLTVRDAGCGHTGIFQIRSAIASGQISGPRLLIPGYPIAMTGGHGWDFAFEVDGPDAVRRAVRDMLRWGADCIKFMVTGGAGTQYEETDQVQMTPEELKAGAEEAKKKSKRTFAHCTNPQGALVCVEAGVDSIDHGTLLDKAALDVMKRSNSFYVPTLYVYSGIATRGKEVGLDEWMIKKAEGIIDSHKKAFQTAYKTGVNIATGTDLGSEKMERFGKIGDDLISEIELMVRYGMTPMDAIKAATYTSSRNLGIENSVGTIEKGKLADLVILDDDPLLDISNLRRVSQVMKEGKIVYKA